jgi:murein DD-endopeptidase MepM/ murein hydrolase activator NlpD
MKKTLLILLIVLLVGGLFLLKKNFSFLGDRLSDLFASQPDLIAVNIQPQIQPKKVLAIIPPTQTQPINYCDLKASFFDIADNKYCSEPPKENAFRLFEINLTDNKILFYENGTIQKTFPIAYQAPYGIWFETPTGYFGIGVKTRKLKSSVVPVFMEQAVQFYEDFFIHNIPYWSDGTKVTSQFSGGCIRLPDDVAKDFYSITQTGDAVVSYATFENAKLKSSFSAPVNLSQFWIRQRYNSPIRAGNVWSQDKKEEYIQHAGLDLAPDSDATDLGVYSIYQGVVKKITYNGQGDAGLGNSVILEHEIDGKKIYSLYGHLNSINSELKVGGAVLKGQKIGIVGNTGYGCNYWKIGKDGCDETGEADTHLHLEIKDEPVLGSPKKDICVIPNGKITNCVGYTSDNPWLYGYQDPMMFLFDSF